MTDEIRVLGKPKPALPAPWRRFQCSKCGARKDQRMRRPHATGITCVCGGKALAIAPATDTPAEFDWWVNDEDEYVHLDRRMMQTPLNRPLPVVELKLPLWKALWERIRATL